MSGARIVVRRFAGNSVNYEYTIDLFSFDGEEKAAFIQLLKIRSDQRWRLVAAIERSSVTYFYFERPELAKSAEAYKPIANLADAEIGLWKTEAQRNKSRAELAEQRLVEILSPPHG
jgi:hypothetical protein